MSEIERGIAEERERMLREKEERRVWENSAFDTSSAIVQVPIGGFAKFVGRGHATYPVETLAGGLHWN